MISRGGFRNFWLGGGGGPNFGSERTVELFCAKLLLTETTTSFLICERRLPLAWKILLCEQRRTDHRRIPKNNYIFEYPKSATRVSLRKISQLKSDMRSCRCKDFCLKQAWGLMGVRALPTLPWICHWCLLSYSLSIWFQRWPFLIFFQIHLICSEALFTLVRTNF